MNSDMKSRVAAPSSKAIVAALGVFKPKIFQSIGLHGNTKWQLHVLCGAAIAWAWSIEPTLTGRYASALTTLALWFPTSFAASSYQGFIKALVTRSPQMLPLVQRIFRRRMEDLPGAWKIGRWVCFAVDGTKVELPWTAALETSFGLTNTPKRARPKRKKRSANSLAHQAVRPQAFLTLLWHVASGLPWTWRIGAVGASERDTLRDMLEDLPANALLLGDAGFNGYDLWRQIIASRRHFLIRVGRNVTLLKKLGYRVDVKDDAVYLWPETAPNRLGPPLVLRMVKFSTASSTMCVVTDLTDGQLSDKQATELYRRRWGVEGFFRGFKQTYRRRKLLSESPAQARCELEWSLVGLWLISLTAAEELIRGGETPDRMSVAGVLRVAQRACGREMARAEWRQCLRAAVKDTYKRKSSKQARHPQRKKRQLPCGEPNVVKATTEQRRKARIFAELGIAA